MTQSTYPRARSAGRNHSSVAWVMALAVLAGCGGGGGSGNDQPTCTAGVSQGFSGALDWVAGTSGVGTGADGQGGVGIQPALGISPIVGARVTVRRADGSAIGNAVTGNDGRVTLKACDAAGPFLVEVEGTASASYFDAARGAAGGNAPFGEGEVLRTVVPALTANIGVTAATEAVAQRLLGRASATASRTLPTTTVIAEAYRQVLDGAWRPLWPQALAVESLTLMPGQAVSATLADRPADRYALALAALGYGAAQFNVSLAAPTLAASRQFATDAADGMVDGRDANGVAVAAIGQATYDAGRLRTALDAALAVAARAYATQTLRDRLPAVLALGALALPDGAGGATPRVVRLGRDGAVALLNPDGSLGATLASDVVALASASQPPASALFLKRTDGSVWAAGVGGAAGLLGLGVNQNQATPAEVVALRGASAISLGSAHALARMPDGSVLGWGDATRGQLTGGASSALPVLQAGVSQSLAVLALNDLSFALQQDGRVLAWGTGAAALGAGGTDRRLQAQPQAVQTSANAPLGQALALAGFAGPDDATIAVLRADGTVWTWGENTHGGLGTSGAARALAVQVAGVSGIVGLAATDRGFVAVDAGGALFFWGSVPVTGAAGTPTVYSDPYAPRRIDGLAGARVVQSAFAGLYQARVQTQGGDRWQTDGFSARQITPASELDTRAIAAGILTIAVVSGDDLVNAADRSAGVVVSGTLSEADRPVTVEVGVIRIGAQVSGTSWTATLPSTALPTTGTVTFGASFVTGAGIPSAPTNRTITVDAVAPTVTVTDNVSGTANGAVTYTFTWSEPPTAFGTDAVVVSGGAKGVFSQVSATTFTLQVAPPVNSIGDIALTLAQGAALDGAGNPSAGPVTTTQPYKTDFTPPTLDISDNSGGLASGPVTVTFTWTEPVSGFTVDDVVVTNAATSAFTTVNSRTYTVVLTPAAVRGAIGVSVPVAAVRDAADNASTAAFARTIDFDTALITYDYGGGNGGGDSGGESGGAGDSGNPGTLPAAPVVTATAESGRLRLTWDRPPVVGTDPNTNIAYYLVLERDSETSTLTRFLNRISVTAATPLNARFSVLVGGTNPNASYRIRACNGGSGSTGAGDVAGQNWCRDSREFRSNGIAYPPEHFWPDRTQVDESNRVLQVQMNASGRSDSNGAFTGAIDVTLGWNTEVGEFDRDDVTVDRGTITYFDRDFAFNFTDASRYRIVVEPPPNTSGPITVSVRSGAVRSVVTGPNALTQATFQSNTLIVPSTIAGRAGELTVLAGFPAVSPELPLDGYAISARFREVSHLAVDSGAAAGSGVVYVSDSPRIRQIIGGESIVTSPPPAATTGVATPVDGTLATATIRTAGALAPAGAGVVYFADDVGGPRIRRLVATGAQAGVTTLAAGTAQGIRSINGMAFDASRNVLYVADSLSQVVWRVVVSPTVSVSVFAGGRDLPGFIDGTGTAARFNNPVDVALDGAGNVYVADRDNFVIRRITPAGSVTLHAGAVGAVGWRDDPLPGNARFGLPTALAVDLEGSVYVIDNNQVRRISPTRAVTTVVGILGSLEMGPLGSLFMPTDVAVVPGSQTLVILGFGGRDQSDSRGFGGMVFVARPATRWP